MIGNSLAIRWLQLWAFTAEYPGSIPGWGTNIPQAMSYSQKRKKKERKKIEYTTILSYQYILN